MASLRRLVITLLGFFGLAVLPAGHSFAMTVDDAKASEFFGWFHLSEVPNSGSLIRIFRPNGDKFHALAAVMLTVGNDRRVTKMQLVLARSFIADPRASSFARDIAKSFLYFASADDAVPALKSLIEEIQFRDLRGQIMMRGEPPQLPGQPSAAYRAFAGNAPEATITVARTRFVFNNETDRGIPVLSITAESSG